MTSNRSETKYSKSRKRCAVASTADWCGEQCADLFARMHARRGDEGLQRFVDRRQKVLQQAGMREQRLCRFRVRSDSGRLRRKSVDSFLQRLDGVR